MHGLVSRWKPNPSSHIRKIRKRNHILEKLELRHLLAGDLIAHWESGSLLDLDDNAEVGQWTDSVAGHIAFLDGGSPKFAKSAAGGRPAVRFDATDGADLLRTGTAVNPLGGADDYSVVVAFSTSSDGLVGGNDEWFKNTGIVDANTLGFSADWGISMNATGQISTGMSEGLFQPNATVYSLETGLNDGQLHSAAITRQAGDLSIYIDGHFSSSIDNASTSARNVTNRLAIGQLLSGGNGFTGDIAEIRFYNGQLSSAEVSAIQSELDSRYNNQAPEPVDDIYQATEDQIFFVSTLDGVLANDNDPEGDSLSAEVVTTTQHGKLGLQANGAFIYTPDKNFFGTDSFTYSVSDFRPANTLGTVTIEVEPVYDPPVGNNDSYKAVPNEVLNIPFFLGVLQNDENIDRANLKAVVSTPVTAGSLTLNDNGSFSYNPEGFAGNAFFSYRIDDGQNLSDPVQVLFVVNTPPVANADEFPAFEDTELVTSAANGVLSNDVDADGNALSATLRSAPRHGTLSFNADGSFSYLPNPEFSGQDSFTYEITDAVDLSRTTTATINVQTVNDVPTVVEDGYFALPDQALTVSAENGVLANDFDIDSPDFSAVLIQTTQNGQLQFNADGSFIYTPHPGFEGNDSFSYAATDSIDQSDPMTVKLQITTQPLIISEIMASNATTLETVLFHEGEQDFVGEVLSPDWIEIRNLTSAPISLTGLHLTDDLRNPTMWKFPDGAVIPANGYHVVFASGLDVQDPGKDQNGFFHTNFSLSTGGEILALTSQSGDVISSFENGYPNQRTHITYGADAGNPNRLGYFMNPTPGDANGTLSTGLVADTKFSVDRGFYNEPIQVEITTETPNATIRYTTDGTPPTETNGMTYSGAMTIDTTTNLRAMAFAEGMVPTNVDTASYFFMGDIVEQTSDATIAAGFPERWGNQRPDYGLDAESEFPRIAGDTDLSIAEAKEKIAESLMSIPSFSFSMNIDDMFGGDGIYTRAGSSGKRWERPTSVEMMNPDGTEGFQIDAGVRIQGGAFRSFGLTLKKSFRLLFKTEYGPDKLDYPLFGPDAVSSFDTLTLRMEANDGWQWAGAGNQPQYARDQFHRAVQLAMGQPAPHGRAIHLYINGFYWGLYNIVERPDETFGAAYFGANKYDWDGQNSGSPINAEGDRFRLNRTRDAWRTFTRLTRDIRSEDNQALKTEMMLKLQGLHPDGTRNPDFPVYLDAENMIDYFIVNYYGDNSDWPHKNYYHGRDSGPNSTGFKFFLWDAEWSLYLRSSVNGFSKINSREGIASPFLDLRTSDEFNVIHGDRVHKHLFNGGALYVDPENPNWDPEHPERNRPAALYNDYVDEVYPALIAESARWGDQHRSRPYTRDNEWQREYDRIIREWLVVRSDRLLNRYKQLGLYPDVEAVTFSQRGGTIAADTPITISAPTGKIYFTTDGSDPRLIGGAVNPNAKEYADPISLDDSTLIRARVLSGDEWSAIDEVEFIVNAIPATSDALRISEVHYNPGLPSEAEEAAGFNDKDEFEFIELVNISDATIDLTEVQLQQIAIDGNVEGIDFDFSNSEIRKLEPGGRLVVVENLAAFQLRYGDPLPVAGQWNGGLSNRMETITLGSGDTVFQQFAYSDLWHPGTDGLGFSLEIIDAAGPLDSWNSAESWRRSASVGGSPGTDAGIVIGDSNHDGVFNSRDLVTIFQAGEYEDGIPNNSTFEEGDWNGDGEFDSSDLVYAFQEGDYSLKAIAISDPRNDIAGATLVTNDEFANQDFDHQDPILHEDPLQNRPMVLEFASHESNDTDRQFTKHEQIDEAFSDLEFEF